MQSKCMNMQRKITISSDSDEKFSKKQIVVLLLSIILLGVGLGWLGFLLFGDIGNQCKIMYVSQQEILKLEKARVSKELATTKENPQPKNQQLTEKKLFFGQINQAIALIKEESQKYQDRRSKVIFIVDEFITGEGTLSISKQVHQKVIENLTTIEKTQPINNNK